MIHPPFRPPLAHLNLDNHKSDTPPTPPTPAPPSDPAPTAATASTGPTPAKPTCCGRKGCCGRDDQPGDARTDPAANSGELDSVAPSHDQAGSGSQPPAPARRIKTRH